MRVIIVSDFWHEPHEIREAVAPLRFHGNEVVLLVDMETEDAQVDCLRSRSKSNGMDDFLLLADCPLDAAMSGAPRP